MVKVSNKTPFIEGVPVTSITEKPIRYLGKLYNKTLNEQEQAREVFVELKQGLRKIEKISNTREIQSLDVPAHVTPQNNVAPNHLQHSRVQSGGDADSDNRTFEKMAWVPPVTVHSLHVY